MFPFQSLFLHDKTMLYALPALFFHPDFTVGFGLAPKHALRLVGYTTGWEMNPTLKIMLLYSVYLISFVIVRKLSQKCLHLFVISLEL